MIKQFLMRKMLERQLKSMPEAQRAQILAMVEKDPKLFEQIAKDIKAEMKRRGDREQTAAAMVVMPKYQSKLQALMGAPTRVPPRFNPNGSVRR